MEMVMLMMMGWEEEGVQGRGRKEKIRDSRGEDVPLREPMQGSRGVGAVCVTLREG